MTLHGRRRTPRGEAGPRRAVHAALLAVVPLLGSCSAPPGDLAPGKAAPPLKVERLLNAPSERLDGAPVGKPVVLEFWATWCGPCIAWFPHLIRLQEKYAGRVVFLSVTDEPEGAVRRWLQENKAPGWVGLDPAKALFDAYRVTGRPTTFVLDARGRIVAKTHPWSIDEALLDAVLAGKAVAAPEESDSERGAVAAWLATDTGSVPQAVISVTSPPVAGAQQHYFSPVSRNWTDVTLRRLVADAHGVRPDMTEFSGPVSTQTFDAVLHLPGADPAAAQEAFQAFLGARFGLRFRRSTRSVPGFVLRKDGARPPKLAAPADIKNVTMSPMGPDSSKFFGSAVELDSLVWALGTATGKPVLDKTGVSGRFDIEFAWDRAKPGSLEASVLDSLGLRLTAEPVQLPALAVSPRP